MEQYVVKVLVPCGNQYVTFRQFEVTGWRNATQVKSMWTGRGFLTSIVKL
jgi:hypothetical protein